MHSLTGRSIMGIQIRKIPRRPGILRHMLPLIILILPLCSSFLPAPVFADDARSWATSANVTKIVDKDGRALIRISVPGRPPEIKAAQAAAVRVPDRHEAGVLNTLSDVPAFNWAYGCSATSAAMLFGYYDRTGYSNFYAGPANGGVCPLDNSVWGAGIGGSPGECPINASHNGKDGRTTRGHVDDYWITYGSASSDPYITNGWAEHTADSAGDFMGTNQSKYANTDGSTSFYFYPNGDPIYNYTVCEPGDRDGCHGMKLFVESRGYTVQTNFSQLIQGQGTDPAKGFTFANFCGEIDAGRPVLMQVTNHTMVGYGYNTSGNVVYIHNTWDYSSYSMTWGGSYSGLQHYGVTVLRLNSTSPTVTNASGATDVTATTATLNGNLTSNGGADTTVHIYWGIVDRGATATGWDHDVNLGILPVGAFSTTLTTGLTTGTTYYYRCSATNSAGTAWASSTASFTPGILRLIGANDATASANEAGGYMILNKWVAESTGNVNQIRVKAGISGNVKVAIYANNAGEPGTLINANSTGTAVTTGWYSISIPSTPVVAGTTYWLGFISDGYCVGYVNASSTMRYKTATYSSFSFPNPAGTGFTPNPAVYYLLAGWGTPPVLTITTTILPDGIRGTPYSQTLQASGGSTPYTWSTTVGSLPAGLALNSSTGVISGTPSTTGTSNFTIQVADSAAGTDTQELSIAISNPAALNITTDSLPDGAVGTTYTPTTLTATGGIPPYTWAIVGSLPAGLSLNTSTGAITGTPTAAGISSFTARVTDSPTATDTQALSITVTLPVSKLIGANDATAAANESGGYMILNKWSAESTGNVNQIRVKAGVSGNVKVAIYADNAGEPGALLNANSAGTPVTTGWCSISIPSTLVVAGTTYWLGFISGGYCVGYVNASSPMRYKTATYSSFSFPNPAGIGFTPNPSVYYLLAGWGTPPSPPGDAPALLSPGTAITFKWGAVESASTYYLQVNTSSGFTGTDLYDSEVGNVTLQEVTGLSLGTTYYWRVKAGNDAGWGPLSAVRSVITNAVP